MNDAELFEIMILRKEVIEKREEVIINNVYQYSREYCYEKALMFIGAGHRRSIIENIRQAETTEILKLNWEFVS